MSPFQIFQGASADQAFGVINMKKCKKTADITVNDTALDILRTAATMVNVLDQAWAFAILFDKPVEAGFYEPRAALEQHLLLHTTDIDDSVVISIKYGGIEYSSWELISSENADIQEVFSQHTDQASIRSVAGGAPRTSTSKPSRNGSGKTPQIMDARSRLRLKYETQLWEKNLALWFALQKKHKAIAARKPRGTHKTTQEDYWLDVFVQIFPDMSDNELSARLLVLESLEDIEGNGWGTKWRSFTSVQAYKPTEAMIDAAFWAPIFSYLSKGFEEFMLESVAEEQPAKPSRVHPSGPFNTTSPFMDRKDLPTADQYIKPAGTHPQVPFTLTSPIVSGEELFALEGFDKPKFQFLTNKQATSTLSSTPPASSAPISVLQQSLPLFSGPSLFSNIGTTTVAPNGFPAGKNLNKTLPLGLQKPWTGLSMSTEIKSVSPFIFDSSKLSGTVFSPRAAAATTPFVFGASSEAVAVFETEHATDEESENDSSEVVEGISEDWLEDASTDVGNNGSEVSLSGSIAEESTPTIDLPADATDIGQILPAEDTAILEENGMKVQQSALYTVGEYLTDNITHLLRCSSKSSRAAALEKYAKLNAHYGVGLSSPCPPTWTRPLSILKWGEVVTNFATDFVELTMPGVSQAEKDEKVTFLINDLKATIGEAWETMDDITPLPAVAADCVKITISQAGDKFEDDEMSGTVNGYDLLAQHEYDASRSETAINDEQYDCCESESVPSYTIEVTVSQTGDKFEDDAICATANGYDLLAQREYDASRTETTITDEQFTRIESPPPQLEITISRAGDKFEDDAMYGSTNGYELLAQCEYDMLAVPYSSPIEISIAPNSLMFEDDAMYGDIDAYKLRAQREYDLTLVRAPSVPTQTAVEQSNVMFEDDAMYGDTIAYELLAEREYCSTDTEDEAMGDEASPPSSTKSTASSPERPLSPDDGMYIIYDMFNGHVGTTHHRIVALELGGQEQTCFHNIAPLKTDASDYNDDVQSPEVTNVHPFGTPGPLTFTSDIDDETQAAAQDPFGVEKDILVVFEEDNSASDSDATVVVSDDEDFGYAKIATKVVRCVPLTHKLDDSSRKVNPVPLEDMRDWMETICDQTFAIPMAPHLPMLQLETTAFSSLFDSDMLFGISDKREDFECVLPELSDFSTPLSPKTCTDEASYLLDLAFDVPDDFKLASDKHTKAFQSRIAALPLNKPGTITSSPKVFPDLNHNYKPTVTPTMPVTPPEPEQSCAYYRRINEEWAPTPQFEVIRDDYKVRVSER